MTISWRAINRALEMATVVSENGRVADPGDIEEWANEVEFEATERGYADEEVKGIREWMLTEFGSIREWMLRDGPK